MKLSSTDIAVLLCIIIPFCLTLLISRINIQQSGIYNLLYKSRRLTAPALAVTLVSSWYTGVLGATQIAYKNGVYNFVVLGIFWYIAAIIFTFFISEKIFKSKAMTLPQLIANHYGKRAETVILALLSIKILPIAYIISLFTMLSFLLQMSDAVCWGLTLLIASFLLFKSSFLSIILVDFVQFITIFSTLFIIIIFCIIDVASISDLISALPHSHKTIDVSKDLNKLILWFLVAISTTILSPIFFQRSTIAYNSRATKKGILLSMVFWLISDILTTLGGLYAYAHIGPLHNDDAFLMLIHSILPEGLIGYAFAALLIICISALDSHLFASKSLIWTSWGQYMNKYIYYAILAIFLFASIVIAIFLDQDIEKAWLLFDSAFISSMLVPSIFAIKSPKSLKANQFVAVVTITFIASAIVEFALLSAQSSGCVVMSLINLLCVVCFKQWNKKNISPLKDWKALFINHLNHLLCFIKNLFKNI